AQACQGPLDVVIARHPVAHGDPHHAHAARGGRAEPGDTLALDLAYDTVSHPVVIAVVGEKAHQPLVDRWRCHDLGAGKTADALDQASGMSAAAIDDLADSRTAERAHRRVDREAARTPRPFGIPVLLIAKFFKRDRISRVLRKGRAVGVRMLDENEAGVEWQ